MKENYVDELAEWVAAQKGQKNPRQKHIVAFLAVKNDVQCALAHGYAMKSIWQHLKEKGRLFCRYETFVQHVGRYIKETDSSQAARKTQSTHKPVKQYRKTPLPQEMAPTESNESVKNEVQTFKFNQNRNLEDFT